MFINLLRTVASAVRGVIHHVPPVVASAVGVGFIVMAWGAIVCVSPCGAERDESRPYA